MQKALGNCEIMLNSLLLSQLDCKYPKGFGGGKHSYSRAKV